MGRISKRPAPGRELHRAPFVGVEGILLFSKRQPISASQRLQLHQPTVNNWPFTDAQLLCFARFFFTGESRDESYAGGPSAVVDKETLQPILVVAEDLL